MFKIFLLLLVATLAKGRLSLQDTCKNATDACLSLPEGCLAADTDCSVLALVSFVGNATYQFELAAAGSEYVALAFSEDRVMADDASVDCILIKDEVVVAAGFNGPKVNGHSHNVTDIEVDNLSVVKTTNENGQISCTFTITSELKVEEYVATVDDDKEYYLLLAAGPVNVNTTAPVRHTMRLASNETFVFSSAAGATFALITLIPAILASLL